MKKLISIVSSAYNEENSIDELAKQLRMVFDENPEYDFEVILVENGSTDGTFERMRHIHENDGRFKIVQLSRNFRMDGGVTAGLTYARGAAAVIMTANLQDRPAIITEMIKKWEDGYENVYGIVRARPGKGLLRRLNSQLFYALANWLTGRMIPRNVSDFRLVSREVYEAINHMPERNRFLRGMFAWTGFRSIGVEYERAPRFAGRSHARFLHVLQLAIQGLFAFSYVPIRFIAALGFCLSGISLLYLIYTVIKVLTTGVPFPGYGTIVSLILLMFGFLFLTLGVLGQYIAQIYEEVKGRPNYIVRNVVGLGERDS
ncbi:MAG TPA: glycosyltransferase family 2 protein [Syntrophobacteria bacterium]|nr:glycosyltransferase family 2 protein [Syntrophobacteria bacterium]